MWGDARGAEAQTRGHKCQAVHLKIDSRDEQFLLLNTVTAISQPLSWWPPEGLVAAPPPLPSDPHLDQPLAFGGRPECHEGANQLLVLLPLEGLSAPGQHMALQHLEGRRGRALGARQAHGPAAPGRRGPNEYSGKGLGQERVRVKEGVAMAGAQLNGRHALYTATAHPSLAPLLPPHIGTYPLLLDTYLSCRLCLRHGGLVRRNGRLQRCLLPWPVQCSILLTARICTGKCDMRGGWSGGGSRAASLSGAAGKSQRPDFVQGGRQRRMAFSGRGVTGTANV